MKKIFENNYCGPLLDAHLEEGVQNSIPFLKLVYFISSFMPKWFLGIILGSSHFQWPKYSHVLRNQLLKIRELTECLSDLVHADIRESLKLRRDENKGSAYDHYANNKGRAHFNPEDFSSPSSHLCAGKPYGER